MSENGMEIMRAPEPRALTQWSGAADRGIEARRERERIVREVLKEGQDYGTIPGCGDRNVLHKSGAENITDSLNLYPDYVELERIEDWERPLFVYRYRCVLRQRGTEIAISSGIGSCNSMENRYRWRMASLVCPECGQETLLRSKHEEEYFCWMKRGGCGRKFALDDVKITSQKQGRVPNDDVYTQVNTIDKMAQKRALVQAALLLGFSADFTQDIEDNPESFSGRTGAVPTQQSVEAAPADSPQPAPSGPEEFDVETARKALRRAIVRYVGEHVEKKDRKDAAVQVLRKITDGKVGSTDELEDPDAFSDAWAKFNQMTTGNGGLFGG